MLGRGESFLLFDNNMASVEGGQDLVHYGGSFPSRQEKKDDEYVQLGRDV